MAKNSQHLTTEIAQQQRLIPLQVQYGRLLEMNGPEIEQEVLRALDEMPALEVAPSPESPQNDTTEDGDRFTESDHDLQMADYSSDDDTPEYLRQQPDALNSDRYFEPIVADYGETLYDALSAQIAERNLSDTDRHIALYIAGNLDENGYLTRSPAAIATDLAINENITATTADVERLWQLIRTLDPAGVGATNLRDCLLLQLQRLPDSDVRNDAISLLTNHFNLFSNKNFDRIAKRTGMPTDRLRAVLDLIAHLNPKPGSVMDNDVYFSRHHAIVPDFSVEVDDNRRIHVTLLNRLPELRIEQSFDTDVDTPTDAHLSRQVAEQQRAARSFIRQNRDDARSFIRLLQMRSATLFQVMEAIARIQSRFFLSDDDDEAIRPMVLRDIANITGLDLSVISRAAQGKYVATANGVYPLKKFFNEKPRQATDDSLTANRIIAAIRSAIENEDPSHPLSDRQITEQLVASGFDIARRTVAKYRENLGYPTGRLRKHL